MAKIERFEDLQSWQKVRQLTNLIYDITNHNDFSRDYRFRDQIRNAAGSIMHNIAEGFNSGTNMEFIRFLRIARRSASEVQSQLYLALDRQYITQNDQMTIYNLAEETKRLINGLINYLHASSQKGNKK